MHDTAIVGAGPVGIELAILLRSAGLSVIHLEAGQIGQTMFDWPPETRWFSSPEPDAGAGAGAGRRTPDAQKPGSALHHLAP